MEDLRDHVALTVAETMRVRGIEGFEILERAPLLDHAAGNHAVLVRLPSGPPEILILHALRSDWRKATDPAGILAEAMRNHASATRDIERLLKRYANERNRSAIVQVLTSRAAGEITREQAKEVLGLPSVIDVVKLEHEFGIHGVHRMVDASEDIMVDLERMESEDRESRSKGAVPASDYHRIRMMREIGISDALISKALKLRDDVPLPTVAEIEAYTDSRLYGIEAGAPAWGVTISVRMGTKQAKITVEATDGVTEHKVAHGRWAGRDVGEYVDAAMERLQLQEGCPLKW